VLASYEKQIQRRAGPHYFKDLSAEDIFRQNYYHRWMAYVVPQLVWDDPRASVGSTVASEGGEEFELELMVNRWIEDSQMRQFLARGPASDMQYNFGVVVMTSEPMAGARPIEGVGTDQLPGDPTKGGPPPRTPWTNKFYRIPQGRYFEDALAQQRDDIRLQGHIWARDKDDILREGEAGGWDLAAIQDYATDSEVSSLGRPDYGRGVDVKRDEIVGADIWVEEYELEEGNPWGVKASPGAKGGAHGTMFTILVHRSNAAGGISAAIDTELKKQLDAARKGGKFPRAPRPWFGSERGPYVVFGQYTVPNNTLPLGALTACEEEIRQLNTDVGVAQALMRAYKRLLIAAKGSPTQIEAIKDGVNDFIYRLTGVTKDDLFAAEIGGLTDQSLQHIQFSKDNLEGTLGFNDMHAGNVSGVGTATEQTYAENASQARFAGIQQAFEDGVLDMLYRGAFCIYNDNRYAKELGPKEGRELMKRGLAPAQQHQLPDGQVEQRAPEPIYLGGERQGIKRVPWQALSIKLVKGSMERNGEARAQGRTMAVLQVTAQMVQLAAQYPTFGWGKLAQKLGAILDFPELGEMFGNPDQIAEGALQVQMAMQGGQGGGGQQPRVPGSQSPPTQRPGAGGGSKPGGAKQSQSRGAAGARPTSSGPSKLRKVS